MAKVSGLIFSADSIAETLQAARHLLEVADEVVIVYSKSYNDYKKLLAKKHDDRIRPFYTVRLGYVEPLRAYGIRLCRYNLIAMLDVDERFSDTAKAKELLKSGKADVYVLYRHEIFSHKIKSALYTKQYRLFGKHSLEWRGIVHETPKIRGRVLDEKKEELYIKHNTYIGKKRRDYNKIMAIFPVETPIRTAVRDAYVLHGFQKISIAEAAACLVKNYVKYKHTYANLPDNDKEIVKELRKRGLIDYLELEKPKTVREINEKYKDSRKQGLALLLRMLKLKYRERTRE